MGRKKINFDYFFLFAVTCFENQVNGWQATYSYLT